MEQAAGRWGDGVAMQVVLPASVAGPRGGEPPWCGGEDGGCGGRSGRWRDSAVWRGGWGLRRAQRALEGQRVGGWEGEGRPHPPAVVCDVPSGRRVWRWNWCSSEHFFDGALRGFAHDLRPGHHDASAVDSYIPAVSRPDGVWCPLVLSSAGGFSPVFCLYVSFALH